ncbi:MAG: SpoIIE family protein phosphatase [Acidobacteria bacterium]|nr:SpoIIE family protein phosphatase [Acidobacteriota bacterium]
MKLRAKLILSFLGLAVAPLAAITVYSYHSSLRALHTAAKEESSAMASDMGSRMESVSRDINRQIAQFAAFEFQRVMAMNEKERKAAMEAMANRLKIQMGENLNLLKSVRFTPMFFPPFAPPPPPRPEAAATGKTAREEVQRSFEFNFTGGPGSPGPAWPNSPASSNGQKPPMPPFSMERLNAEVRSGDELVGKVSAEISSQRLLYHVLMRTQPRQGEIPFAIDANGKVYATNPNDLNKIQALPVQKTQNASNARQQVSTLQNWVVVTQKDSHSDLTFGIARPIGDRLGDLRRTTARNMAYGLGIVALALIGIVPLSSRMTRNLTVLTKEAENLGRGDLNARVQVASKDEFGKLALAFNRMAAELSENQKHLLEQERMRKELEMCRKIQEELLPRTPFRSGAVEVKGVSIPAREVGGDFFNYFPMPDGTMALLIGDVSGKGLPAALLMANLQATIQARLPLELDLVKLAEQLDSEIAANNAEAYLTLFIAVLDLQSLRLRYVNAGHNTQFLLHNDGSLEKLKSTGRPIGLLAGGGFQEKTISLRNQDSLFFYTDGFVETVNEAGEEFGMERLETLLVQERSRGLEGILANLEVAVNAYRGGVEAADDATMMLLKIGNLA